MEVKVTLILLQPKVLTPLLQAKSLSKPFTPLENKGFISLPQATMHATERYGVKALGEWLANEQGFEVEFKDMDNPA